VDKYHTHTIYLKGTLVRYFI